MVLSRSFLVDLEGGVVDAALRRNPRGAKPDPRLVSRGVQVRAREGPLTDTPHVQVAHGRDAGHALELRRKPARGA